MTKKIKKSGSKTSYSVQRYSWAPAGLRSALTRVFLQPRQAAYTSMLSFISTLEWVRASFHYINSLTLYASVELLFSWAGNLWCFWFCTVHKSNKLCARYCSAVFFLHYIFVSNQWHHSSCLLCNSSVYPTKHTNCCSGMQKHIASCVPNDFSGWTASKHRGEGLDQSCNNNHEPSGLDWIQKQKL